MQINATRQGLQLGPIIKLSAQCGPSSTTLHSTNFQDCKVQWEGGKKSTGEKQNVAWTLSYIHLGWKVWGRECTSEGLVSSFGEGSLPWTAMVRTTGWGRLPPGWCLCFCFIYAINKIISNLGVGNGQGFKYLPYEEQSPGVIKWCLSDLHTNPLISEISHVVYFPHSPQTMLGNWETFKWTFGDG